jgi:enterochelin esterase-like enzyme
MEPQSAGLFVLLLGVFGGLLAWLALTKQPAFRVLAACLAFIPAMLFGMAAVNKYYDYYQSWGAVTADFGGQGLSTLPSAAAGVTSQQLTAILGRVTSTRSAASDGETVRLMVTGARTHISRAVYVYLPPQYFQAAYQRHRFPAAELISGYPGGPLDWINVMGVIQAYQTLLRDGLAQPVALVMPDPNGARHISLQCLNVVHGPQDATYLAQDLPDYLSRALRLVPPGPAWGIGGYSEGGYCAANLALLYPGRYGAAGVLSGYFQPLDDRLGNPAQLVDPFAKSLRLRRLNTPPRRLAALPFSVVVPQFWLGAGGSDRADVSAARAFQQRLLPRQPNVALDLVRGGVHSMPTWRALVPPLLIWLTGRLVAAAEHPVPQHPVRTARPASRWLPRPAASHG